MIGNSQGSVYNGAYFSKVAILHRKARNCTISRLHHRFFLDCAPKNGRFKKNNLKKRSIVYKQFSSCNHAIYSPHFCQCFFFRLHQIYTCQNHKNHIFLNLELFLSFRSKFKQKDNRSGHPQILLGAPEKGKNAKPTDLF